MPDCIGDEKALKRPWARNRELIERAEEKLKKAAADLRNGNPTREGLGFFSQMAGFFGQRFWFGGKVKKYSDRLKIREDKCIGCGLCAKLCPMDNLSVENRKASPKGKCTMCYRCVNHCPEQAITLLGSKVYEQYRIGDYL